MIFSLLDPGAMGSQYTSISDADTARAHTLDGASEGSKNMNYACMQLRPMEKGVLACTMYLVTGLWLSGPESQDSCTVVSVMSVTTRLSGAPGGPATSRNIQKHPEISRNIQKQGQTAAESNEITSGCLCRLKEGEKTLLMREFNGVVYQPGGHAGGCEVRQAVCLSKDLSGFKTTVNEPAANQQAKSLSVTECAGFIFISVCCTDKEFSEMQHRRGEKASVARLEASENLHNRECVSDAWATEDYLEETKLFFLRVKVTTLSCSPGLLQNAHVSKQLTSVAALAFSPRYLPVQAAAAEQKPREPRQHEERRHESRQRREEVGRSTECEMRGLLRPGTELQSASGFCSSPIKDIEIQPPHIKLYPTVSSSSQCHLI
ncbi:hypothetical protein F7725_016521 [Dissostichus mawsoni]|uniref:Uncharacterized protein n=1 Tax=Dissostichus mawsoni TaxID=36200 RepID=A0A7J5Z639_DISMA|nr:hypothetical protein F7725_016521 [Dissostichus mawsoni]